MYFENTYGENQDNRSQRVLAKADPFTVEQLENINAHIFHLGSLLADDFSLDVVKYLSTKGILAVVAQGYLHKRFTKKNAANAVKYLLLLLGGAVSVLPMVYMISRYCRERNRL